MVPPVLKDDTPESAPTVELALDWRRIVQLIYLSRAIDEFEIGALQGGERAVYESFPATGQELAQIVLGCLLTHKRDAACGYYRSRPLALALGVPPEKAVQAILGKAGSSSGGRDAGAMLSAPGNGAQLDACSLLPPSVGSGGQFASALGWARSILYHCDVLQSDDWGGSIAVALGGEFSLLSEDFWQALNAASAHNLPCLFFILDNGYGNAMVAGTQTPGGDLYDSLRGWKNLKIVYGDGARPEETPQLIAEAVDHVRNRHGACIAQLSVPRLAGHTAGDEQPYKPQEVHESELARDPLHALKKYVVSEKILPETEFLFLYDQTMQEFNSLVLSATDSDEAGDVHSSVFAPTVPKSEQADITVTPSQPQESKREHVNFAKAIGATLDSEMSANDRIVTFGENVVALGGLSGATSELASKYGSARVFDVASPTGSVGSATGMALAGLLPVIEVSSRLDLSSATKHLRNIGTMRWRTNGNFTAPMVIRLPTGAGKSGSPWKSLSDDTEWARLFGWHVAVPSTAADAVGLLRQALRGANPTLFLEHQQLYEHHRARGPYPEDSHTIPFGSAKLVTTGNRLSVISWGAMVHTVWEAVEGPDLRGAVEIIDLRTIQPWDKELVFQSVSKTGRCLIVHEDNLTAGFGAEIAAQLAENVFWKLDAPLKRLAMPDFPMPYNETVRAGLLPGVQTIREEIDALLAV